MGNNVTKNKEIMKMEMHRLKGDWKRLILIAGIVLFVIGQVEADGLKGSSRQIDFNFGWKFQKGDFKQAKDSQYDDSSWRQVHLPHDWSIEGPYSQDYASGTGYLPGGIGWYRKSFQLDKSLEGKVVSIEFDGVYNNSEVWINGHYLGKRPYGYSSFRYDLTDHVKFAPETNVIAVKVDHSQFADSRWYTGSGIYRNVRLVITDKLHIAHWGVFVATPTVEESKAQVNIETTITNEGTGQKNYQLQSDIIDMQGKIVATQSTTQKLQEGKGETIKHQVTIENQRLWDIEAPYLYKLTSTIKADGKIVDSIVTPFGIRTFRFDPNNGFFLNGKNIKMKGVCLHHDGGCVGAAVPLGVWQRRLILMKQIGVNAIRTSHNPPAPEFLDMCDRMGFVVMDEAFDEFTPGKNKWVRGRNNGTPSLAGYNEVFEQWAVRDIGDMVRRDRNHPSIVIWSIGNEVDYPNDPFSHPVLGDDYSEDRPSAENLTKYGRMLVGAVKKLDTTRPVTAALANAPMSNAVGFADLFDVVGYNYQEQRYETEHANYPNRCILGSENSSSLSAWQAVENNDYVAGQFIWTGIDYLGEAETWPNRSWSRALFDLCGFKKPHGWFRQSIWTDEPMVYIACRRARSRTGRRGPSLNWARMSSHWNWPAESQIQVLCCSNCDEVELFLNDKSLGIKPKSEANERTLSWDVPFETGVLKAVGRRDGRGVCEYKLKTAGRADRIKLLADTKQLKANGKDVCLLEFRVVDPCDVLVSDAEVKVTFTVEGPGKIIGLDNANPSSSESFQGIFRNTWQGRGLAVIQSLKQPGKITITAESPDLKSDSVTITAK